MAKPLLCCVTLVFCVACEVDNETTERSVSEIEQFVKDHPELIEADDDDGGGFDPVLDADIRG